MPAFSNPVLVTSVLLQVSRCAYGRDVDVVFLKCITANSLLAYMYHRMRVVVVSVF